VRRIYLASLLSVVFAAPGAGAAEPPGAAPKPPPVVQSLVARGPSSDMDRSRLADALKRVAGVAEVQVRPGRAGAGVTVKGDVLFTLLAAAAKPAGYTLELTPVRHFAAAGTPEAVQPARLKEALLTVPGVDRVELGQAEEGLAVRVSGIAPSSELAAAAKSAGFGLRQLAAYSAAGPTEPGRLSRLREALQGEPGVEAVEMQSLDGGVTLLVQGDAEPLRLSQAAGRAGYTLSALRNAGGRRAEFQILTTAGAFDGERLLVLARDLEGTEAAELVAAPDGQRLAVTGDRLKPERIAAAAAEAGFRIAPVDNVSLPSLTPRAGRVAPASYQDAVLEDPLRPGDRAPLFGLLGSDGRTTMRLESLLGKRPVVLIFGSCT
jgi:copper chaperone CopZ